MINDMKDFNELGKEVLNLLLKSRSGVYQDTSENRRKHRVGQKYGEESHAKNESEEFISILKKNPSGANAERQLELMNDGELERFARFATTCSRSNDLNSTTQKWCKQWADMARSNKTERGSDKSEQVEEKPVSGEKGSKREQREARLKKYQEALSKVREKLNDPNASEESKKMGKDLEAKWVEKISKLEKKLGKKAKTEEPEKANIKEAGEQAIKNAEKKFLSKDTEPETSTKEIKESKVVNKIVEQISKRNPNFSDERIARVKEVLLKNEKDVSKFMGGKFPSSAGGSFMFPNKNSIKLETGDEIVFQSFSEKDTTSRSPRFSVGTNHYYRIVAKYGSTEKELYRTTYTKDSYRPENPSEIKERCKVEALMRYFHI